MEKPPAKSPLSPRRLAACRANIRKAHEANRRNPMSPARLAALRKAQEANRKNFRLTPARLAAMGVNIRKAQAASVRKFRMTPARVAACRATIRKAIAAKRSPESYARSRFNDLKHGLYARTLEDTFVLLGEDPKEFEELWRLLERAFAVQDDVERKLIRRIAEALWRRLRFFRAQARWEADRLKHNLSILPPYKRLSVDLTRMLAYAVFASFVNQGELLRLEQALMGAIERRLRALLRKRSGGDPQFKIITRESQKELRELEKEEAEERMWERLESRDPEALALGRRIMFPWKYR